MKKIMSLLVIVMFLVMSYTTQASAQEAFPKGRVTAVGAEPNGDGQEVQETNQAGVTALGAGSSQVKTCKNCQQAGNVLLSSASRRASPGVKQQVGAGHTNGASSSSEPVNTGN